MVSPFNKLTAAAVFAGLIFTSSSAMSSDPKSYQVTITNITNGTVFTPILVASHRRNISLFELGSPASGDLERIAEGGDTSGLAATLASNPDVVDIQDSGGLLGPGQSITVIVSAAHGARRISLAAMMLPTNDGFIALDSVRAPRRGSTTYFSPGYDAGTEENDELCAHIPGPPPCFGSPFSDPAEGDEGYVHIHRGIQGIGDLTSESDWRNPVAKFSITRIRNH